jgi:acyl-CoA dehydrogenase
VGLYISEDRNDPLGRLEYALKLHHAAEGVERTLRDAVKAGTLQKAAPVQIVKKGLELGIITQEDAALVRAAEEARTDAIQVDSFTLEEYMQQASIVDDEPAIEAPQAAPPHEVEMA